MEGIRSYVSMNKDSKDSLMPSIYEKVEAVTNLMRAQRLEDGVEFSNVADRAGVPRKEPALL
jgi:hypothetical protein